MIYRREQGRFSPEGDQSGLEVIGSTLQNLEGELGVATATADPIDKAVPARPSSVSTWKPANTRGPPEPDAFGAGDIPFASSSICLSRPGFGGFIDRVGTEPELVDLGLGSAPRPSAKAQSGGGRRCSSCSPIPQVLWSWSVVPCIKILLSRVLEADCARMRLEGHRPADLVPVPGQSHKGRMRQHDPLHLHRRDRLLASQVQDVGQP